MLPSEIPKLPTDPSERVFWCLETSLLWLLAQNGCPSLTLCLFFYLLYFVLPPFKDNGLPFWCLVSSASVQKLFCGICSVFKWYFDEFVGEKVVLPFYSSTILGLPTSPYASLIWKQTTLQGFSLYVKANFKKSNFSVNKIPLFFSKISELENLANK